MSKGVVVCCLLIPGIWVTAFETYSSQSIEVLVIDGLSEKPAEGAIIVADWTTESGHGVKQDTLALSEVRTNADGRAQIPAWGPRFAPRWHEVSVNQPTLRTVRIGYLPSINRRSQYAKRYVLGLATGFESSTGTLVIRLDPDRNDSRAYEQGFDSLLGSISSQTFGAECGWLSNSAMLRELMLIAQVMDEANIPHRLRTIDEMADRMQCDTDVPQTLRSPT